MRVKKASILAFILISGIFPLFAQTGADALFGVKTPLHIAFSVAMNEIRESKKDSIYITHMLYYQHSSGKHDSIEISIKSRGNFRLKECYYPPLWFKITKNNAKGTLFEGNKKLKLVLPCDNNERSNTLILKEFLCYKLYEEITPWAFRTRLAEIDLTELGTKKRIKSSPKGIFIEDVAVAAIRLHAKPLERVKIAPTVLNDTSAVRFELFQYMISNTDWSVVEQHNAKLFVQNANRYIPIAYDFDMSGIVDAPYAVVSHINGRPLANRVTDRVYRGYCRSPETVQFVRREFLLKKANLLAVPDQLAGELSDKDIKRIKAYLEEFFSVLENDRLFQKQILNGCRVH